jgi:predicted esterase
MMHNRTWNRRTVLAACGALALLAFAPARTSNADILTLLNGRTVEGTIVEEDAKSVTIQPRYGTKRTYQRMEIKNHEKREKLSWDEYEERTAAAASADDHFALAEWCEGFDALKNEARIEYDKVLELNPFHRTAHERLGHVEYDGYWYKNNVDANKAKKGRKADPLGPVQGKNPDAEPSATPTPAPSASTKPSSTESTTTPPPTEGQVGPDPADVVDSQPLSKAEQLEVWRALNVFLDKYAASDKRKEALEAIKKYDGRNTKGLRAQLMRNPVPSKPKIKGGTNTLQHRQSEFHGDTQGECFDYILNMTGKAPYPFVLLLHGGGAGSGDGGQISSYMGGIVTSHKYSYAAPTTTKKLDNTWNRAEECEYLFAILQEVAMNYDIDYDRILVMGHSMGGFGSWWVGPAYADRFAGIGPSAGGQWDATMLQTLVNLPVYCVHGYDDTRVLPNFDREAEAEYKRLADEGPFEYPFIYKEVKGTGADNHGVVESDLRAQMKWLSEKKRDLYAKTVILHAPFFAKFCRGNAFGEYGGWPNKGLTAGSREHRSYWLEAIDKPSQYTSVRLVGEYKGNNRFDVTAKSPASSRDAMDPKGWFGKPKKYALWLSDEMVDLDKPIEVYTNGVLSYRGRPKRSMETMFEEIKAHWGDRGYVWNARIEIKVP